MTHAELDTYLTEHLTPLLHHDAWLRTLQIATRFPRYSPTNQLLIAAAHPEALRRGISHVANHGTPSAERIPRHSHHSALD